MFTCSNNRTDVTTMIWKDRVTTDHLEMRLGAALRFSNPEEQRCGLRPWGM